MGSGIALAEHVCELCEQGALKAIAPLVAAQNGGIFATIWHMLIVVDTNIFVGACLGKGACNQVIALCLQGLHTPVMGSALMAEYEAVLGRTALFARSRLNASERDELLDIFLATCQWRRVYYGWRPNLPDEGDNHLFELAIAAGAPVIVSRSTKDLARGELRFTRPQVQTPEHFVKEKCA